MNSNNLIFRIRIVFASLISLLISGTVVSQQKIEVTTMQANMSKGKQTCYYVNIPQAGLKTIKQQWMKKLQANTKTKVTENGEELVIIGMVEHSITKDTMNIYSMIFPEDTTTRLAAFFEIDSVFFSPNEAEEDLMNEKVDKSIQAYLREFAVTQYRDAVTDELDKEQEKYEDLQKELKKLVNDEEDMEKAIPNAENDIKDAENSIDDLERQMSRQSTRIEDKRIAMAAMTSEEMKSEASDEIKEMEKERHKLQKKRDNERDKIIDLKSDIKKNEKGIENGKKLQEEKQEEINQQKLVVDRVTQKLAGIK